MKDNQKPEIDEVLQLAKDQGITLDPCLLRDYPLGTLFWPIHHQKLIEPLEEPLVNRVRYILTEKPKDERKIRLRALRPVQDVNNLPDIFVKARAEYVKARAECDKARAECGKDLLAQWDKEYPDHPAWDRNGLIFWGVQ
jgi:hypothetical protein